MKRSFLYNIAILLLSVFSSCTTDPHENGNISDYNTFVVSDSLIVFIDRYIELHPQFKSLTVLTDFEYNWRDGYKNNNVILIGPSFDDLFGIKKIYPSTILRHNGRIIFIQSSQDCLCRQNNLESTYHKYSVKLAKTNDNVISYLKLAFAINAIGRNSFTFTTNHADSLVLRKRVEFIPPDI